MPEPLLIAKSEVELRLLPQYANRHGLIAGATGTGKTVTLQRLAEGFSRIGVPVFMADVKGDLAGLSQAGEAKGKVKERLEQLGLKGTAFEACPVVFWDAFGSQGHPVRTTISEMGPLLLARMLGLNETQAGVLTLAFKIADDNGLLLLDLKDLRAMLTHVGDNAKQYTTRYGNVSSASIGAIQRGLLALEQQGGDRFFGEPALNIADLMQADGGRGVVNILAADKLMSAPKLYSTLLLWLLSELFEALPEVGDPEKPKLVFFFDEAHLLFNDAPAALLEKIEQVVRLIRSKGVGVYFVTQNPLDIPDAVLGQLGNRVQHALRAFTPRDQKAVKTAATTLRANPKLDVEKAITELAVGEALVSFLDDKGRPTVVERALVMPPGTRIGPITAPEREKLIKSSGVAGVYDKVEDRESAYEKLAQHVTERTEKASGQPPAAGKPAASGGGALGTLGTPSSVAPPGHGVVVGKAHWRLPRRAPRAPSAHKSAARSSAGSLEASSAAAAGGGGEERRALRSRGLSSLVTRHSSLHEVLIAFNKPFNVLCQFTDGAGRRTLANFVTVRDVYPAGRLDYDSEGLVLLTDDGALQKRIADPSHRTKKTYLAQVERIPDDKALARLRRGVKLRDGMTAPAGARLVEEPGWLWPREPPIRYRRNVPTAWLEITLTEGRNRQIRRMTAAVGHPTLRLVRVSIGAWSLNGLRPGEWEVRR